MGLKIMTVDIDVLTNGALLLLSTGLALLFFKKDQDKFEMISLALISAVGLLTIVFTGTFSALLFLLPAIIFALLYKFKVLQLLKNKIVGYVALGLVGLGVLIFVMSAFNIGNITALWQSNAILRKLFFNSYLQRFYVIFQTAFSLQNLTGSYLNTVGGLKIFPTGSFIFDALWLDGLLGFVALAAFLILFIRSFYLYFVRSFASAGLKVLLTSFLLTAFFRYVFIYPFHQYTYKEYASINHFPLLNAPVFLVTLFIAGFTFVDTLKEEVVTDEEEN
jgi:hypothetical protein